MIDYGISKSSLGATAYWTAAVRARESRRADRLFNDPWATALAGDLGETWLAQHSEEATLPLVVRTRYFDDFLLRVSSQEGVRNVVILAAGRARFRTGSAVCSASQRNGPVLAWGSTDLRTENHP